MMNRYAPLFCSAGPGRRQWSISLIRVGAMSSFGSPVYFVQKMFPDKRDLVGGGYRREGSERCHP